MTSQLGKQTITKQILTNISRSKGKQTIKFGQLIEYNMRNIFLKKSFLKNNPTNVVEKLFTDPFLSSRYFAFTSYKAKKKKTRGLDLVSLPSPCNQTPQFFYMIFEEKYFSCFVLLPGQISLSDCLYFVRYWEIYVL